MTPSAAKGVIAIVSGQEILVGNRLFLHERNVAHPSQIDEKVAELESDGKTAMLVARGNVACGIIAVADTAERNIEGSRSRAEEYGAQSCDGNRGQQEDGPSACAPGWDR